MVRGAENSTRHLQLIKNHLTPSLLSRHRVLLGRSQEGGLQSGCVRRQPLLPGPGHRNELLPHPQQTEEQELHQRRRRLLPLQPGRCGSSFRRDDEHRRSERSRLLVRLSSDISHLLESRPLVRPAVQAEAAADRGAPRGAAGNPTAVTAVVASVAAVAVLLVSMVMARDAWEKRRRRRRESDEVVIIQDMPGFMESSF